MSRMVATELMTSAWCPLDCKYCYIPKTDKMLSIHRKIEEDLKSGRSFGKIHSVFGDSLRYLGFWGTEPSTTLPIIEEKLCNIHNLFPNLKKISFSTSLVNPEVVASFANKCSDFDIGCAIQVSVDGPSFIMDKNRFSGASAMIIKNVGKLVSILKSNNSRLVELRWKATLTIENIIEMVNDAYKIDEYYEYFKNLNDIVLSSGVDVSFSPTSYIPTLAVPCSYTSDDGKIFAKFLKLLYSKGITSAYFHRLAKIEDFQKELLGKRSMFTCSGGDSNCGIENCLHICHRSFYFNIPEYIESLRMSKDFDNWDISTIESGNMNIVSNNFIPKIDDAFGISRFKYNLRGYHDFWNLTLSNTFAMVRQAALCGQCNSRFIDDDWFTSLFSTFLNVAMSCPMENLLNTGSLHVVPISIIRMFGNGAFEELINELSERK